MFYEIMTDEEMTDEEIRKFNETVAKPICERACYTCIHASVPDQEILNGCVCYFSCEFQELGHLGDERCEEYMCDERRRKK